MLLHIAAAALLLQAQPAPPEPRGAATVTAVKTDAGITIDGRDSEPIWLRAPRISDFRQFEPRVDADPSFKTEFRVAYDERNLYVFVRMHDPQPDSIMHALSRRDVRGPSDQVKLLIDSYNDRRTGFQFAVNPDGVKRDYTIFNDGQEDGSWNGIWEVATQVDSLGWTAEFRIPLSQLRYTQSSSHTFGFGVWRDIERYRERVSWPLWSPKRPGLASQLGQLTGLSGISTARRVEVTPYTVAKNVQRTLSSNRYQRDQQLTAGGDLKLGLTPNITLDATVNPDFGQVEADPAVLNLTAFETFLAERRPFFIEGTSLYQFQLNCYIVVDCQTNEGLFYSRRIGRSPQLRPLFGDAATPTATPIAAAAKLTGRTGDGLSFGVLNAYTPAVAGTNGRAAEPGTNYAVVRAQQDLRGGQTGVSAIVTAVNRSLDAHSAPYLHEGAYAAGLTFRNRFRNGQYELNGLVAASHVTGAAEAIARTQRNAVHYYQQPGDQLELDPSRTGLSGHSQHIKFGKYAGGVTRFETSLVHTSAGFDVNDLGYLRRADLIDWSTWAALSFREARGIYRWAQFNLNHWESWNTSNTRLENAFNLNGHMGLRNNWDLHAGATLGRLGETYCDRCTRGGPPLRQSRAFSPWGGVNTDSRRVISASFWLNATFADDGHTESFALRPSINLRFSTRMQASVGATYARDRNNTQWFGNFSDGGSTRFTFAHLNQRTVSLSTRLNYTVTPDLTFEFYGQPFVATGQYSDVREVSATPDAPAYADRFKPFTPSANTPTGFKFMQLRTNAVARWEYRPGSTLFLVWAHGRQDAVNRYEARSWTSDYRDLFALHPDNTFLIKIAYWLNR